MPSTKRRYSKAEFAHRGDALVERKVRPNLAAADEDKVVAIDIETGEYELDKNEMKAVDRLRKRVAETDNQASPLPRLLFRGGKVIITNAFAKKSDKLPPGEKDRAQKCMKDYERRVKAGSYYAKD